jgi:hypothetical protein
MTTTALPDDKTLQELERKFDPEMRFRPLTKHAATLVGALLLRCRCSTTTQRASDCCRRSRTAACTWPWCWG